MNICRACGNTDFASVSAFDRHRIGVHAYTWSPEREDGRRCMDAEEMLAAGMELDEHGRWRIALTEERLQSLKTLRELNPRRVTASEPSEEQGAA